MHQIENETSLYTSPNIQGERLSQIYPLRVIVSRFLMQFILKSSGAPWTGYCNAVAPAVHHGLPSCKAYHLNENATMHSYLVRDRGNPYIINDPCIKRHKLIAKLLPDDEVAVQLFGVKKNGDTCRLLAEFRKSGLCKRQNNSRHNINTIPIGNGLQTKLCYDYSAYNCISDDDRCSSTWH